jgi:hypothetical protein
MSQLDGFNFRTVSKSFKEERDGSILTIFAVCWGTRVRTNTSEKVFACFTSDPKYSRFIASTLNSSPPQLLNSTPLDRSLLYPLYSILLKFLLHLRI